MSYFFLIADPGTGLVVRRDHQAPLISEMNLYGFRVPKTVWKKYKAGDVLYTQDLTIDQSDRWLLARAYHVKLRVTAAEIMRGALHINSSVG